MFKIKIKRRTLQRVRSGKLLETSSFAPLRRSTVSMQGYLQQQVERLLQNGRFATARNYRRTQASFAAFAAGRAIPLVRFDERVVAQYAAYLAQRRVVRNTVSFYMRILRAVYNRAVRERLAPPADPFACVYTGVDRTRKRAVDERVLRALRDLPLEHEPVLSLTRDLFFFSYYMRGMAFVDMAFLRKSDLSDGVIRYVRRKTGQPIVVRVEPCMQRLVERYLCDAERPYLLPLLRSEEPARAYMEYLSALGRYNRNLKRLGGLVGIGSSLTSYTSRHTWATVAHNLQVPVSVISAGMGHSSERTTAIYLAALEEDQVDRANRLVLAGLKPADLRRGGAALRSGRCAVAESR